MRPDKQGYWFGRSLGFMRALMHVAPVWPSAREVILHLKKHGELHSFDVKQPRLGDLVWFDTPMGNVGMWLGEERVLMLSDKTGYPIINHYLTSSPVVGWSEGIPRPDGKGFLSPDDEYMEGSHEQQNEAKAEE